MLFKINSSGYRRKEVPIFSVDRPNGSGDYLFVHFLSDITMLLEDEKQNITPGACIVFAPGTKQIYNNPNGSIFNSYFHFDTSEKEFFDEINLPLDTVLYPNDSNFLEEFFPKLEMENMLKQRNYEIIIDGMLRQFFASFSRNLSKKTDSPSAIKSFEQFKTVRFEIIKNVEKAWTLEEMAEMTNLCTSRFSIKYKEFFGISPISDLILARVEKAKSLLSNEALSVFEISDLLGYNNVSHFVRQFKTFTGYSPKRWINNK